MKCRFSRSQIVSILQEYDSGLSPSVAALCIKHRVSRQTYYHWRAKYGRPDDGGDAGGGLRLSELEGEIGALRRLVSAQIALVEDLQQRLSQSLACIAPPARLDSPKNQSRAAMNPQPGSLRSSAAA